MASVATTEFLETSRLVEAPPFSLIEAKGLAARLAEELTRAVGEISRDPSGFFRGLFSADDRDEKRRRLIYAGLVFALIFHAGFLAVAVIAGWHRIMAPVKEDPPQVIMLPPPAKQVMSPNAASEEEQGKGGGGGGGGRKAPAPASEGQLPKLLRTPPLIAPRPESTPRPPSLPAIESVQVDPRLEPKRDELAVTGLPTGVPGNASAGPGSGGGIGDGNDGGIGTGNGRGVGPGSKIGKGGRVPGNGDDNGSGIAEMNFRDLGSTPSYTPFSWLRRPTPVVTPEAQENKVIGIVLLRATFHADGTVSDIEVVMPVEFMTESAIDSLMRSKFRPATVNGKPITVRKVPVKIFVHY